MYSDRILEWLADIHANALQVSRYIEDVDEAAFSADAEKRDAVERCLERISEAASRIHRNGVDLAATMPDIPWADIRAIGNRLRHAYERIDSAIIWLTATRDLPPLLTAIDHATEA